jgi:hypothetical protein
MHIYDYCKDKALNGDRTFAVAFALLELAEAQKKTARALDNIGFNEGSGQGIRPPGTTEKIAMELARVADALAERSSD